MNKLERNKGIILAVFAVLIVVLLVFGKNKHPEAQESATTPVEKEKVIEVVSETAVEAAPVPTENPEDGVFSYLQGPKSWKEQREWSGKWGKEYHDGGSFGAFGCGFCAMANIYSTLTEYKCTPLDIYAFAKKNTYYAGGGAIAWPFLRKTMSDVGFTVKLGEKPSTYNKFRSEMEKAQAMLVLVSSYNDDSYWKDTPGHYVTLFLYDSGTEEVMLTDSGDPNHNRQRVPLKTIYKALKTSSDFQYMSVLSYDESKDTWKHKTADGVWVKPERLQ